MLADMQKDGTQREQARIDIPYCLLFIDMHETTASDETEIRPALSAREGTMFTLGFALAH